MKHMTEAEKYTDEIEKQIVNTDGCFMMDNEEFVKHLTKFAAKFVHPLCHKVSKYEVLSGMQEGYIKLLEGESSRLGAEALIRPHLKARQEAIAKGKYYRDKISVQKEFINQQ